MKVAVIGAGVAGLTCAYRLTQQGHTCDVYERWPGLGGQAATIDVGQGHLLERYYHHLFTSDRHIAALYEELGMPDELEWRPSSVAFFLEGRSWPFTSPLDLLRFRPLSLRSRIRMGVAVLRLQRGGDDVAPFERMTAREWIARAMGGEAYEKVWGPLLRGKFGDRADDISMAWLWGKLTMRRKLQGKESRQELLGYPRRSWEPLFGVLRDAIEAGGGRVLIDRPGEAALARASRSRPARPAPSAPATTRGRSRPAGTERYEAVVATVPNDVFRGMLDDDLAAAIGSTYLERLDAIEYHTALCLLLELNQSFTPYYWTNIADPELPFVGVIEHTNLIERERYDGRRFLYIANYLAPGDELLSLSPEDADRPLRAGPAPHQPGLRPQAWIKARWLHSEPAAQPIVTVGYGERIPPLQTGVPGLVLANTTQIYPEDRGTNYAVRLGDQAAAALTAG